MNQRIRFGEPFEPTLPEERLPPESLLLPHKADDAQRHEHFQVYLVDVVRQAIQRHVSENPRVEAGGILVGHPFTDRDVPDTKFVVIVGAVRQDSNSRSAGHFTVDPAEIAASREELEKRYPGLMAVGWYHSHPGLGIFLSTQDMRIVHSIYNAGWQVALVLDPQRQKMDFFHGPEGKRLSGWLELQRSPDAVVAIGMYNHAIELRARRQFEEARSELVSLTRLVHRSAEMQHWTRAGGYRDTAEILRALGMQNPRGPSIEKEASTEPQADTVQRSSLEESGDIPERYMRATKILEAAFEGRRDDRSAGFRYALQLLEWIEQRSPGYRETKNLLYAIRELLAVEDLDQAGKQGTKPIGMLMERLRMLLLGNGSVGSGKRGIP